MVPPCRKTIEVSLLQYTVINVPVVQVEQDISPSWRSGRSMVQTVRRTFFFHSCSTRWPMSLLCRSSCFLGAVIKETVEISQLLRGGFGLMGGFLKGPAHRYRAGGRVHRDMAPIIRRMRRDVIWINICHQHLVRTTTTTTTARQRVSFAQVLCAIFASMASVGDTRVDHASGAARRRRERRLRAYLKYARMSVAMALAQANHHTAPREQKTATAEATNATSKERVAGDAVYFELFDEDTAGLRPGPVLDPRPQKRVQRHTMEQMIDVTPYVQILDAPVPQTVEQLLEVFRLLDTQMLVEHVIAVPKISLDRVPQRLVERRLPQMVE